MKKPILGLAALFVVGLLATGAYAFNMRGNEELQEAVESGDYEVFNAALKASNITKNVTQEQFDAIATRHAQSASRRAAHDAALDAIENNDYAAWKDAMMQELEFQQQQLTLENFNRVVERSEEMPMHHGGFKRHLR